MITRSRHLLDIVTLKDDFILLGLRLNHSHSLKHVNVSDSLLTEEVTNLHLLSLLVDSNVDGEVSVHKSHLVTVSVSNSSHHVLDVGADRSHDSDVLVKSKPQVNNNLSVFLLDVNKLVAEVTTKSTARSLDDYTSILDVHFD